MSETNIKSYIAGLVQKGKAAQKEFERKYTTQRSVDEVVRAAGLAIVENGRKLAEGAVGETGMGNLQGKLDKINGGILAQWNYMRGKPSVGVIDDGVSEPGIRLLAKPLGVIGCVMPSTNPIITVIGNAMIAFKCRNAVIIAPHPASAQSSMNTTALIREALGKMGVPEDLIQCIEPEQASIEATQEMLKQCDCNIATGGAGMVKAVYSSGRPSFGVGPGNCQAIIDEDYDDMAGACKAIVQNRSFDLGVPCTGEQTVHVPAAREAEFLEAMREGGSFIIEDQATIDRIRELVFPEGKAILNRATVGKTVQQIGEMLGIAIPVDRIGICFKNQAKGTENILCKEMLCPVIRYRTYTEFEDAVDAAVVNLELEGAGHSSSIWTENQQRIDYAANLMPVGRFHIKQPTRGNANGLAPTVTVGCGSWGNNSICENLQYQHLMNKTKVTVTLPNKRFPQAGDWDDFGICPVVSD